MIHERNALKKKAQTNISLLLSKFSCNKTIITHTMLYFHLNANIFISTNSACSRVLLAFAGGDYHAYFILLCVLLAAQVYWFPLALFIFKGKTSCRKRLRVSDKILNHHRSVLLQFSNNYGWERVQNVPSRSPCRFPNRPIRLWQPRSDGRV